MVRTAPEALWVVSGHERRGFENGRCDDQVIGWFPEAGWQFGGLGSNSERQREYFRPWRCQCVAQPVETIGNNRQDSPHSVTKRTRSRVAAKVSPL